MTTPPMDMIRSLLDRIIVLEEKIEHLQDENHCLRDMLTTFTARNRHHASDFDVY